MTNTDIDHQPIRPAPMLWSIIYLLFFLSGFCGLVYEIIWMRRFAVSFGNTTYAVTAVLAAFMGGLALGSRWFGLAADSPQRKARLLSYYGWMEIGVGVYCLAFESLIEIQDKFLLWFYHSLDPGALTSLAVKFVLSVLLVLVPTILMGGTLPVLIKSMTTSLREGGSITGRLYFVNCAGAVLGTLLVAFWMIPVLGMSLSTAAAAAVNIVVGLVALKLRSYVGEPAAAGESLSEPAAVASPGRMEGQGVLNLALVGIFTSGFTAMVYEISWTRLLALVLGSSTYSFSVMLAAFISGIALGSYLISRQMARIKNPGFVFALCQLAIGVTVLLMLPAYSRLPLFFIRCRELVNFSYEAHEAFKFAFSLLVMLIPATAFGMGFPLVSRLAAGGLEELAGKVGGVYALNTLGNISGSVLCGLAMIPFLGVKLTLEISIILNLAAGAALIVALGGWKTKATRYALGLGGLSLVLYSIFTPGWDRQLLSAGAFRYHPAPGASAKSFAKSAHQSRILFYHEGIAGTVTVEQNDSVLSLRVNGKADASNAEDMNTQLLLAHLPMLLHSRPARVLVIGAGSGVSCGAALAYPELDSLTCVEISPDVIEGSRLFAGVNRHYWEDHRARIVIDDARNFLFRSTGKWDIITSEPSNPWMAGIGSLYTEKFYENCRDHLAPGGIICQWIHLYEMDEQLLKIILRTFMEVFPNALAFASIENIDLLLLGSMEKIEVNFENLSRRMGVEGVARDLNRIGIKNPLTLLSTQVMDTKSLYRWAGVGPTNTDNFPLLEYKAPRGFFSRSKALLPDRYRFGETATLLGEYRKTHQATATELTDLARYYTPFILTSDMVYSALADALRREPENQEALKLMAQVLTRRNQLGEADEVLKRLASAGAAERELFELSYPVALALAQRRSASFINLPDYSTALAIKERLAELEPSRSIHYFHLGEIYQRLARFSQAADAFQIALKLRASENNTETPDLPALIHLIGKCYLEGEDFTSAEFWFSRLAREYPQEPLGQEMLRLVIIEKLIAEGGRIDAERLRKALPE